MGVVLSNIQSSWRDSYAASPETGLTLRANGEEKVLVWDGISTFVNAGFDAPSIAPAISVSSGGTLEAGKFYAYVYVYAATTRYPFVENAVTAGGSVAPRSNPSPSSVAAATTSVNKTVNLTIPTSNRSDVDRIWIYRTEATASAEEAVTRASAGDCYFIASVDNNQVLTNISYTDTGSISPTEQVEIDNFVAPIFQYTVYDGIYWWGFGNNEFIGKVTLNGLSTISLNSGSWFTGRNGEKITFQGVDSGGFDNIGTFYFKCTGNNTGELYSDPNLTIQASTNFYGTTTCKIQGAATTIYRSKIRNPFSWGFTDILVTGARVPQQWAYKVGGGKGVAIAVHPTDRLLKVDTESPNRCYTLNLNNVYSPETVGSTFQIIEDRHTASSHSCQFSTITKDGQTVLGSIDVKNFNFLRADAQSQVPITTGEMIRTLRQIVSEGNAPHFFHGVYDAYTELNCWWVKTLKTITPDAFGSTHYVDTLIWNHAPTGFWGKAYDFDVSASCSVYDKTTKDYLTFLGLESGQLVKGFDATTNTNIAEYPLMPERTSSDNKSFGYLINTTDASQLDGKYVILRTAALINFGIWFKNQGTSTTQPPEVDNCTNILQIDLVSTDTPAIVANKMVAALGDGVFWNATSYGSDSSKNSLLFVLATNHSNFAPSGGFKTNTQFTGQPTNRYISISIQPTLGSFAEIQCNAFWFLILDEFKKPYAFARCIGMTTEVFFPISITNCAIDRFHIIGTDYVYASINLNDFPLGGKYFAPGQIYSSLRTYFTMNTPSSVKRNIELWVSAQNVDDAQYSGKGLGMFASLYKEFSEEGSAPFKLSRDSMPGSLTANSVNYLSKTNVPSTKLNQFGIELFEVGTKNWKPMSIVFKTENG